MPLKKKSAAAKSSKKRARSAKPTVKKRGSKTVTAKPGRKTAQQLKETQQLLENQVQEVLAALKQLADKRVLEDMPKRYGIYTSKAFGVSMSNIQKVARPLGRNHELAAALWETGWYEARMLTSFVDEPALVTSAQMDRWVRDFDNWGICDTLCFNLFDRTPHAWRKVAQWCKQDEEFIKRTGFALLWSLTVHDKESGDQPFLQSLVLILRGAYDERHFVKKAVNMALRAVGKRNWALNAAAVTVARRLSESPNVSARWVGKDALRELTSPSVIRRLGSHVTGKARESRKD